MQTRNRRREKTLHRTMNYTGKNKGKGVIGRLTGLKNVLFLFTTIFMVLAISALVLTESQQTNTLGKATATGFPHIQGALIVDGNGQPLLLRGGMIETSLAYINAYKNGTDPLTTLTPARFAAMSSWGMNAVRINMSYWIYLTDSANYLSRLDTAINRANQAGLYVVADFHDDGQSGSPYGDGMMHKEHITWWTLLANRYKNNPMVMFDLENEPKYTSWNIWTNGDNSGIVGFQTVINAIRQTGAQNIIVVEPGTAGGHANFWNGYPETLTDPNVVYSLHYYENIINGNPQVWNSNLGPILGKHPVYYGEWAALANANNPVHCAGLTSDNADSLTNTFLSYMDSIQASWTAWDFESTPHPRLIQDDTTFTPSNFQTGAPWVCNNGTNAGMGQDVKDFLAKHQPTISVSLTPVAISITPMPTSPNGCYYQTNYNRCPMTIISCLLKGRNCSCPKRLVCPPTPVVSIPPGCHYRVCTLACPLTNVNCCPRQLICPTGTSNGGSAVGGNSDSSPDTIGNNH